ncbi:hypothetical protein JZ751_018836 [Albula glossodonta]|uniref:Uncharacterized protein n=1 Tax=Albula glossodonta TaxID=121402 RepID=A0A8T2MU23_9TELE|nr:hypothetical protein JZ751_018836 [Albula glossodonta]
MNRVMNTVLPLMSMTVQRQGRPGKRAAASFSKLSAIISSFSSSWESNWRVDTGMSWGWMVMKRVRKAPSLRERTASYPPSLAKLRSLTYPSSTGGYLHPYNSPVSALHPCASPVSYLHDVMHHLIEDVNEDFIPDGLQAGRAVISIGGAGGRWLRGTPEWQVQLFIPAGVWAVRSGCLLDRALKRHLHEGPDQHLTHTHTQSLPCAVVWEACPAAKDSGKDLADRDATDALLQRVEQRSLRLSQFEQVQTEDTDRQIIGEREGSLPQEKRSLRLHLASEGFLLRF